MTGASAGDIRQLVVDRVAPGLKALGVAPEALPDDYDLFAEGVIDSFGIVELVADIEERYGVEIALDGLDAEELTVVGPLCRYIEAQLREAA